jgi:hypothetical protein
MARYKMTVVFDVHEDENRERRDQLAKKFFEKKTGKSAIWPTLKEQHELNALTHDPLQSDFLRDIAERMNNRKANHRTTYDILSFKKLKEE